jgi:hypothetical protein
MHAPLGLGPQLGHDNKKMATVEAELCWAGTVMLQGFEEGAEVGGAKGMLTTQVLAPVHCRQLCHSATTSRLGLSA